MQNSQTNTFIKGMNLDTAKEFISSDQYIDALDVHINTDNGATAGALQPYIDLELFDVEELEGHKILGTARGHKYIDGQKKECYIVLSHDGAQFALNVFNTDLENVWSIQTKNLQFTTDKNVKLVNLYEDSKKSRVYMSQEDAYIQVTNINGKAYEEQNTEDFSIFPKCGALPPFQFNAVVEGNKVAGKVQYAYQLFNADGKTTALSAISHMIPIGSELNGDLTEEGISIRVDNIPSGYEYIRIFELNYTNFSDLPRVYIKDEIKIPQPVNSAQQQDGNTTTVNPPITVVYEDTDDKFLSEYTLEQFQAIKSAQFKAGTIEIKDNRLFAANITETTWDIEFDARVYQADENGLTAYVKNGENVSLESIVSGSVKIPEEYVYNPDTDVYKYNTHFGKDLDTGEFPYGGAGVNVSYMYVRPLLYLAPNVTKLYNDGSEYNVLSEEWLQNEYGSTDKFNILSDNVGNGWIRQTEEYKSGNIQHDVVNVTYKDTYVCSNYVGFKQGEYYTFGIIFYNESNIPSPVHTIGTVRIPYFTDWIFGGVEDGSKYHDLVASTVGIRFKVDIADEIRNQVTAYEIVRVQKETQDRHVILQGVCSNPIKYPNDVSGAGVSLGEHDVRCTTYPTVSYQFTHMYSYKTVDESSSKVLANQVQECDDTGFVLVSPEISINKQNINQYLKLAKSAKVINRLSSIMCSNGDFYANHDGEVGPVFSRIRFMTSPNKSYKIGDVEYYHEHKVGLPYMDGGNILGLQIVGIFSSVQSDLTLPKDNKYAILGYGLFKYYISSPVNYDIEIDDIAFCGTIPIDQITSSTDHVIVKSLAFVNKTISKNYTESANSLSHQKSRLGIHCNCAYAVVKGNNKIATSDSIQMKLNWQLDQNVCSLTNDKEADPIQSFKLSGVAVEEGTLINNEIQNKLVNNSRCTVALVDLCSNYVPKHSFNTLAQLSYTSTGQYSVVDQSKKQQYVNCFGGDTYVCIHKELWTGFGYDGQYTESQLAGKDSISIKYPVETRINLDRVAGPNFDTDPTNPMLSFEPSQLSLFGYQEYPLNAYNDAYSAKEYNKIFVTKGVYDVENQHIGNRIMASEVKSTGELTDSFQDFRIANYLDVDGQYGDITNLVKYNGRLYYLQSTAFGTVSVNERSLITDNNNAALLLGTGDVLQRYDYISTFDGTQNINDNSIVVSPSSLYWYDSQKHSYNVFNQGGLNSLSKVKNVQSYFNKLDKDTKVHSGYDNKYNELWVSSESKSESIIYSEQIQAFVGRYSNDITHSITFGDFALALNSNKQFIKFGKCPTAHEYNKEPYVEFVVNKDLTTPKTYDTLMFTDTLDNNTDTTWFATNFNTNRQGDATINFGNSYKEGVYYVAVGRDSNRERMRDKTMTVKLTFGATEFSIPQVSTIFRYSRA